MLSSKQLSMKVVATAFVLGTLAVPALPEAHAAGPCLADEILTHNCASAHEPGTGTQDEIPADRIRVCRKGLGATIEIAWKKRAVATRHSVGTINKANTFTSFASVGPSEPNITLYHFRDTFQGPVRYNAMIQVANAPGVAPDGQTKLNCVQLIK